MKFSSHWLCDLGQHRDYCTQVIQILNSKNIQIYLLVGDFETDYRLYISLFFKRRFCQIAKMKHLPHIRVFSKFTRIAIMPK